jgi:hypothetical protein
MTVNDESRQGFMLWSFRIGIGASQYEIPIGVTGIGNPHFLSVQNVMISFLFSLGFNAICLDGERHLNNSVVFLADSID